MTIDRNDDAEPVGQENGVGRAPTKAEDQAMLGAMVRHRDREVRPSVAVGERNGHTEIACPHNDHVGHGIQIADTFGTRSGDFSHACINWLANAARDRSEPLSQEAINAALAVVAAAQPANEMEALLAVQMYATHDLSMEMMRRAKKASDLRSMTEFGTLATKLSRTMAAQIEALGKLRRGGEQTVRVEHVHVYHGGQAVVGVVNQGGGSGKPVERGQGPYIAATVGPALLGENPQGDGVPIPSGQGQEALPHPRRRTRKRRAAGKSERA